jgi:hypothetical protein
MLTAPDLGQIDATRFFLSPKPGRVQTVRKHERCTFKGAVLEKPAALGIRFLTLLADSAHISEAGKEREEFAQSRNEPQAQGGLDDVRVLGS